MHMQHSMACSGAPSRIFLEVEMPSTWDFISPPLLLQPVDKRRDIKDVGMSAGGLLASRPSEALQGMRIQGASETAECAFNAFPCSALLSGRPGLDTDITAIIMFGKF